MPPGAGPNVSTAKTTGGVLAANVTGGKLENGPNGTMNDLDALDDLDEFCN